MDGVGLAPAGPGNPLSVEPTPTLRRLLGGPLTRERPGRTAGGVVLEALDACLGVDGLPQSATGQTALFTGVNASRLMGRHITALPGPRLRRVVEEHGLLRRATGLGAATTFANAYSAAYLADFRSGRRAPSVTTWAAESAALELRELSHLRRGRAVTWDVTRDLFAARSGHRLRPIAAATAGRHLAAIAAGHRLTVYETFLTDLAGHRRWGVNPAMALARLDGLLEGVLAAIDAGHVDPLTVVLTSDHGNVEDAGTRGHTRNPVPLLAVGPLAPRFAGLTSILEVTPRLLDCLQPDATTPPS